MIIIKTYQSIQYLNQLFVIAKAILLSYTILTQGTLSKVCYFIMWLHKKVKKWKIHNITDF